MLGLKQITGNRFPFLAHELGLLKLPEISSKKRLSSCNGELPSYFLL